ncbi:vesicle-associated membrane protein 3-like isoform X5 [Lineus longissimus]|uniref:vesicle-associated membrane protein 3-like isoform X5 n=1 Tax=Lineus longissimus TaxID=88925 RepID=UPI00315D5F60
MSQPGQQPPSQAGPGGPPASAGGPGGPPPQQGGSKRLQQTQAQVDEVVDIMRVNVDKVLERDQKLSELDGRADALQAGASQFEASAGKLKRKYWWKNCKKRYKLEQNNFKRRQREYGESFGGKTSRCGRSL